MDVFNDIDRILLQYVRGNDLSIEDEVILHKWLNASPGRREMMENLRNLAEPQIAELVNMYRHSEENIWEKFLSKVEYEGYWPRRIISPAQVREFKSSLPRKWRKWKVAAVLILLAGAGVWMKTLERHDKDRPNVAVVMKEVGKPGSYRATLTLANGRILDLDSSHNGELVQEGSTKITKLANGRLKYEGSKMGEEDLRFNILATPRAGQYSIALPDGTQVWLNNVSWLRYPLQFSGERREVELKGEAYFEVAKDPRHPFRIKVYKMDQITSIDVLGTAFNIMAYQDEAIERFTLVNGEIQIGYDKSKVILHPKEQSTIDTLGKLSVFDHVDVEEITAWKKGYFHFDHSSLEMTMRQLARWYDVDVVYEGAMHPQYSTGKIQRNLSLESVLQGLENENLHFVMNGRKLVVKCQ